MAADSLDLSAPSAGPLALYRRALRFARETLDRLLGRSARQRHEQALRQAIIDAAPDAIITLGSQTRMVQVNASATRMFAREASWMLKHSLLELLNPMACHQTLLAPLGRLLAGQSIAPGSERFELEIHREDAEPLPVACHLSATGEGLVTLYIRDLSDQKRTEQILRRQREALHQNDKLTALGSLLAGVAHELNNPLSVVVGRSAMLGEQVSDPLTRDSLTRIHQAAERCTRIVRTFLSMARQQEPHRRPTDLHELIANTVELLDHGLQTSGIQVELELDPAVPLLWADADQLGQVFLNLLSNAQQALQDTPAPRSLRIASLHDQLNQTIQIMLADSGPGIPDQLQGRIFDPYFTTKPVGVGTGVGLSICLSIITAHGGSLQVDRAAEGGAQFLITLPLVAPNSTTIVTTPPAENGPTSA